MEPPVDKASICRISLGIFLVRPLSGSQDLTKDSDSINTVGE